MIDLFADVPAVPDCTELLALECVKKKWPSAGRLAAEMLKEAREWQRKNPGKDVLEIVPPDWKQYISYNL